jgi:hypothetical protein
LGDLEIAYAFVVVDASHRAYHPKRGGTVIRFDPATDKAEELTVVINGATPETWKKDHTILNWDSTADQKLLYSVEMTTNELLVFDLTGKGNQLEGKSLGKLLPEAKGTDCRSLCVAPDGKVWMAVKDVHHPGGGLAYLVSYTPGDAGCKVHGAIGIANPDFTTFKTPDGKDKPWHHTIRKEKDGTLTPWQPLGIAAGKDGGVYVLCIAPFTVIEFGQFRKK